MPYDPHALKIYVDGSAFRNPGGPGGLAGIVEFLEDMNRENEVIFEEGYLATTNNRMEILASIRALDTHGASWTGSRSDEYSLSAIRCM